MHLFAWNKQGLGAIYKELYLQIKICKKQFCDKSSIVFFSIFKYVICKHAKYLQAIFFLLPDIA